jgi:hypothetical protein
VHGLHSKKIENMDGPEPSIKQYMFIANFPDIRATTIFIPFPPVGYKTQVHGSYGPVSIYSNVKVELTVYPPQEVVLHIVTPDTVTSIYCGVEVKHASH